MHVNAFRAPTGHGLARAARGARGAWSVEVLLTEQDVLCLAQDALRPEVISAGTGGRWRAALW